jgi:DNA-directed RNA polymerase sigma subunit (sigma70/sigma32)
MYIYKQRKEEKRTFADIGRELGITGQRVRDMYRQLDWKLNGYNADHHQGKQE